MTIEIKMLPLGIVQTNCYVIGDNETGDAVVVDPVDNAETIIQAAQQSGWTIRLILATHAHFDHVLASKPLKEATNAPFYIHQAEEIWLNSMNEQGMMFTGQPMPEAATPDRYLTTEPETIEVGHIRLETLFTPGHSPGHISFHMPDQKVVFSGDCLFYGSIGSVELPHTDYATLMKSIKEQLLSLDDKTQVLSGHTRPTTIGHERNYNPFILDYMESTGL